MPQYTVTKTSLINGKIVQPGTIVEYDGLPGKALKPMDAEGEKRKAERAEQTKPRDANEEIGRGMAKGFAEHQARKAPGAADSSNPPTVISEPDSLTTVGHSSVPQVSSGGVDAQNLLVSDGKGGLVPQNPHSDAKPAHAADSPDDGAPKVDAEGKPAVTVAGESNAVSAKKPAHRK